jgi:NO-binding membrane sensor protein with MHYT domain
MAESQASTEADEEGGAPVTVVHHFAYGWINPTIAYIMSFVGSLLGLLLAARARETRGPRRLRWLLLAALGLGATGAWLAHFMAMLGFDVPGSLIRYDVPVTVAGLGLAVFIVALGLLAAGTGRPSGYRILTGGTLTGLGVAAAHYTGMAALRLGGTVSYDRAFVVASVLVAVVAATAALWFSAYARSARAAVGAALLMSVGVCSAHYTAMAGVRVRLDPDVTISGASQLGMLVPICVAATVVITALALSTVGVSLRRESDREEARLNQDRLDRLDRTVLDRTVRIVVPDRKPAVGIARLR